MYYFYIAIFGAFGAVTRYWISSTIHSGQFPYNTLLINLIGCFFLAVVMRYLTTLPKLSRNLVNGIGTGFIGSFTTFSAFSAEVCLMIARGDFFPAACYSFTSMFGGFLSAMFGFYVSSRLTRRRERSENGN
ncbi:MAG: CrcB family protein [Eubacteriales bacterium]|nr:CrcB family protein [Eubacteriales bacterium]